MNSIPEILTCQRDGDRIRFSLDGLTTDWMDSDDSFTERIKTDNLNPAFLRQHILKEIEMKNVLDEAVLLMGDGKYHKAIGLFDEVLFYDDEYGDALIYKSKALRMEGHYVKALRYYKRWVRCGFSDVEYHKMLLSEANRERDEFPKIKLNIYAGDEHFSKGKFKKACESYDKALINPSKFKDKILFKLLNKKGTALLKLERFDEALACFEDSIDVKPNDYAYFAQGYCQYELGFDISDEFNGVLEIDKNHMLKQALILNEVGRFREALAICDALFENHFKVDEFYFRMVAVKGYALDSLGLDSGWIDEIFRALR